MPTTASTIPTLTFSLTRKEAQMRRSRTYSSRRSNRQQGGTGDNAKLVKLGVIICAPLAMAVLGGWALLNYSGTERIDEAYCYDRGAAQHEVAVFLDASFTTQSSEQQWRDYETALLRAYEQAPANARVSIFTTTRNVASSLLEPAGTMCRPAATVHEAERLGIPSKSPQYLARQAAEAETAYRAMAERILGDARDESLTALDSPILASLQAISRSEYFDSESRTLWVITDGLENSETARFGQIAGHAPAYPVFASQARFEPVRPRSWAGAHVNFLLVQTATLPQPGLQHISSAELYTWWPLFFRENGADSVEVTRLRYGAG
jgi:hypothetical protein